MKVDQVGRVPVGLVTYLSLAGGPCSLPGLPYRLGRALSTLARHPCLPALPRVAVLLGEGLL